MTTAVELTDEQRKVVEQPADARMLVTAQAGSGKTLTVIHRLQALIENEDLQAADILVLSFSRAAVKEIKDRLARYGEAAQHVDVRTFDSYATLILSEADPDGSWQNKGFEPRIREADRMLRNEPHATDLLYDVRHVVVDEIQDLVGERAELVKAILEQAAGGFTLLGDPAQGIYGFQLEDPGERLRGSAALYAWLRARFSGDLVELTLSENFRARAAEALVARPFGPLLCEAKPDYAAIQHDLRTALLDSSLLGELTDAAPVVAEFRTPTAILTRNNGEALLISRELHRMGVPHRRQRPAQDRVVPAWVADLFRNLDSTRPHHDDVARLLESKGVPVDESWDLLKRMDQNRRGNAVDLMSVRDSLARGTAPDELTRQDPTGLVVSTVHRVKGLEFDQVVVVDPGEPSEELIDQAEGARTLYVAMTRPRDLLMYVRPVHKLSPGWIAKKTAVDRWVEYGHGKYRRHLGIEIQGDDVYQEEPAGTLGVTTNPRETQAYLSQHVGRGALVTLLRLMDGEPAQPPRYAVQHNGCSIGVTSDRFSRVLRAVIGRPPRWPIEVEGLRVDCVETVVGSGAAGQNAGMGSSGVWLRPRITGLGRLNWGNRSSA